MDDFLKYIFIAAVIVAGIVREANKKSKTPKTPPTRRAPAQPTPTQANPLEELMKAMQPQPAAKPAKNPKPKKKEEISIAASLANSAAQDRLNALQETEPDAQNNYSIDSAEEARRAIVWAEILQKKYF